MNITDFGGVLASLTGKSEEELLDRLNTIVQDAGEDKESATQQAGEYLETLFGEKFRSIGQQQLDRGIRESREGLEKKLRSQYGIESNAKGEELIEQIVQAERQKAAAEASTNLEELSADQLKGLPQVQALVKPWVEKYESVQGEFDNFKTSIEQRSHADKVRNAIRQEFLSLNPILPKDEAKRNRAIDAFVASFDPSRFAVTDNGIKPLGDNGQPLQDDKYNEVRFSEFVRSNNYFDVHKQDPEKSSPQPQGAVNGTPNGNGNGKMSRAEYAKVMNDPTIPIEKKKAIAAAFLEKKN